MLLPTVPAAGIETLDSKPTTWLTPALSSSRQASCTCTPSAINIVVHHGSINMSDSDLDELRAEVAAASIACNALRAPWSSARLEQLAKVSERLRIAEQRLALGEGRPAAIPIPWEPCWSPGAPLPHVIASDCDAMLAYLVHEPDPAWDGTYAVMVGPDSQDELIAVVTVKNCYGFRFGGPNDEVFAGHPLAHSGFVGYGAFRVENSDWKATERRTNAVHPQFNPAKWESVSHYLLAFHDSVFECICEGFDISTKRASLHEVMRGLVETICQA